MSAELDVRAKIYCNLGEVISGNISEGSIVGAGLVNVEGSIVLSGVYQVARGSTLEIAYYKEGRMTRLGRKLRVISSYSNPVTRTTEVAIGCYLTYQKDSSPPPQTFSSAGDTEVDDLSGVEKLVMIKPTHARYVAEQCCAALGISHDPFPLTNQFYDDEFKISGPYLRVLSDLLISENYVGYLNSQERLVFINLNSPSSSGPMLDENNIIDIAPINSGDPDADVVYSIVNHLKIKLDDSVDAESPLLLPINPELPESPENPIPEPELIEDLLERLNIEDTPVVRDIIDGVEPTTPEEEEAQKEALSVIYRMPYFLTGFTDNGDQYVDFRYQAKKRAGQKEADPPITATLRFRDRSDWKASYTAGGVLKERIETSNSVWGPRTTITQYSSNTTGDVTTSIEVTRKYVRAEDIIIACGFPSEIIPSLPGDIRNAAGFVGEPTVLGEVLTRTTTSLKTSTMTTEHRTAAAIFHSAGAANIGQIIESYTEQYKKVEELQANFTSGVVSQIVRAALQFMSDKTKVTYGQKASSTNTVSTVSKSSTTILPVGKESVDFSTLTEEEQEDVLLGLLDYTTPTSPIPGAPSPTTPPEPVGTPNNTFEISEVTNPKNGYTVNVVDVPEIVYTQNKAGGIILEFTPPYLSDDKVVGSGSRYSVVRSDAKSKAMAFARIQNQLRYGYKNGQAVVYPVEYVPAVPFSPIYLSFKGIIGQYRSDRTNIVFDSTGILVSTDAIFWGGVGQ